MKTPPWSVPTAIPACLAMHCRVRNGALSAHHLPALDKLRDCRSQLLLKEPWECAAGKERGKSQKLEIQGDTRASFRKGLKKGGCHLNLLWRWGVILLKSPCRQPAGALGFCLALNKTEGGQRKRREWRKERSSRFIHFFFSVFVFQTYQFFT